MDVVVDANIIFAALIKDNVTRFLLFEESLHLYAPEYIFSEINKYSDEICEKAGKTKEGFAEVLNIIMRRINIVPKEEMQIFLEKAKTISPDPKDVPYIALALKLGSAIWSNDRLLKENQTLVPVYTTQEIKSKF